MSVQVGMTYISLCTLYYILMDFISTYYMKVYYSKLPTFPDLNLPLKKKKKFPYIREYIQHCMLKLPVWACNKCPFFKMIKIFQNVNKVNLHVSARWYEPNSHQWWWYDMSEDCNFHRNRTFWWKNWSPFCLFLDLKNCPIWQLDCIKLSYYCLEYNERGLVCNIRSTPKFSQLLWVTIASESVWYVCSLMHAKS